MADLHILSYNICFQAMTNTDRGSAKFLGEHCTWTSNGMTVCGNNIAATIEGTAGPLDFVGLQEAAEYDKLQAACPGSLAQMEVVYSEVADWVSQGGKQVKVEAKMATFYAKKHGFSFAVKDQIAPGRPFHIVVCHEVIFINVHNGHHEDFDDVERELCRGFTAGMKENGVSASDFQSHRIVVVGDFNEANWDWSAKTLTLPNWSWTPLATAGIATPVSIGNLLFSCCQDGPWADARGNLLKGQRAGDYIFDSVAPAHVDRPTAYDGTLLQSDHLPVVATLPAPAGAT